MLESEEISTDYSCRMGKLRSFVLDFVHTFVVCSVIRWGDGTPIDGAFIVLSKGTPNFQWFVYVGHPTS